MCLETNINTHQVSHVTNNWFAKNQYNDNYLGTGEIIIGWAGSATTIV